MSYSLSDYNGYNVSCNSSTDGWMDINVDGGLPPYSFLWNNGATSEDLNLIPSSNYVVNIQDANQCQTTLSAELNEPSPLVSNIMSETDFNNYDIRCYGLDDGSITATISGSLPPYDILWSNDPSQNALSQSNLYAGQYLVQFTDLNGCVKTDSIELFQPQELSSTVSSFFDYNGYEISCYEADDGQIDLTVFGGVQPYQYLWNNGYSDEDPNSLTSGYYSVSFNDLNNSLTWQHISKDNQSQSFSYILLSRIFKNKGELNISFNYLLKAEKTAIEKELFEMLSIVYSEIIELSHELILIDIDKYISLKKYNINLLREIDQIDMLLAKIMFDIKTKQNFSKSDPTLVTLINDKIKETKNNKFIINSPRFKMRLFKMYSRVLLQNKEYGALEDYLLLSWREFNEQNFFNRSNHDEKLTLLTYLTNCLHQNNNYKKSLFYAEELKLAMKEFDAYLEDKYLFYYYNSLVLNYSIDNKILILQQEA